MTTTRSARRRVGAPTKPVELVRQRLTIRLPPAARDLAEGLREDDDSLGDVVVRALCALRLIVARGDDRLGRQLAEDEAELVEGRRQDRARQSS